MKSWSIWILATDQRTLPHSNLNSLYPWRIGHTGTIISNDYSSIRFSCEWRNFVMKHDDCQIDLLTAPSYAISRVMECDIHSHFVQCARLSLEMCRAVSSSVNARLMKQDGLIKVHTWCVLHFFFRVKISIAEIILLELCCLLIKNMILAFCSRLEYIHEHCFWEKKGKISF